MVTLFFRRSSPERTVAAIAVFCRSVERRSAVTTTVSTWLPVELVCACAGALSRPPEKASIDAEAQSKPWNVPERMLNPPVVRCKLKSRGSTKQQADGRNAAPPLAPSCLRNALLHSSAASHRCGTYCHLTTFDHKYAHRSNQT